MRQHGVNVSTTCQLPHPPQYGAAGSLDLRERCRLAVGASHLATVGSRLDLEDRSLELRPPEAACHPPSLHALPNQQREFRRQDHLGGLIHEYRLAA